jgi:hypothetical protein
VSQIPLLLSLTPGFNRVDRERQAPHPFQRFSLRGRAIVRNGPLFSFSLNWPVAKRGKTVETVWRRSRGPRPTALKYGANESQATKQRLFRDAHFKTATKYRRW